MNDPLDAYTPEPSTPGVHRPPRVNGWWADRVAGTYYVVVAATALYGQANAAVHWLDRSWLPALVAVSVIELAAIVLSARADYRRRLGEAAVAARVLAAVVAAFMTGVNFAGHWLIGQQVAAWFYSASTALGYLIWVLHSAARRRDQLRAEGKLGGTAPEYGATRWICHPRITHRARQLALRNPALGLYGSWDLAVAELRRERRNRALSRALRRRVRSEVDDLTAEIATLTYDMDEIAARLAAGADYDGLTDLIAQDLTPERLAAPKVIDGEVVVPVDAYTPDDQEPEPAPSTDGDQDAQVLPMRPPSTTRRSRPSTRRSSTASTPTVDELADTLCREHCTPDHPAYIGRPTALATLKRVYGSCGLERAREAKDVHNARHASTGDRVDEDDQESEAVAA